MQRLKYNGSHNLFWKKKAKHIYKKKKQMFKNEH